MRPSILGLTVLGFVSCGPDFTGDRNIYSFRTTLSRPTQKWKPDTPVALGESFFFENNTLCFFSCAPAFTGASMVPPNGVLIGDPLREVTASQVGSTSIVTNAAGDSFGVTVREPAGLTLVDPLELSRPDWPQVRGPGDGGPPRFPDPGAEELVVGADAGLYLDIVLVDDGGHFLASRSGLRVNSDAGDTTARSAQIDGRLIDIHTGAVGTTGDARISRYDGGLSRTWSIRTAGPEEITSLELAQLSLGREAILHAVVRRADGGVFFEPELVWTVEGGVIDFDYTTYRSDLRTRRDVKMYRAVYDGGVAVATVRANGLTASVIVDALENEPPPEPRPPPPSPRQGCGTTGVLGVGCVVCLALVWRKRRRGTA